MGIKDLFLPERGDFSKILGQDSGSHLVYVDKAEQATKVAVDENGCSVASYTVVEMRDGAGMPDKKYQFNCNRSFLLRKSIYPLIIKIHRGQQHKYRVFMRLQLSYLLLQKIPCHTVYPLLNLLIQLRKCCKRI